MRFERHIGRSLLGAALLLGAAPSSAGAPAEPLIVTQLPDPDPNYVPPPSDRETSSSREEADRAETLDEAMADFGRALGQAAMVRQQAVDARCRSTEPPTSSAAQRFAWEASCRYSRH